MCSLITSPITSYAHQILSIHRDRTSAGFALEIPLIMLTASIMKYVTCSMVISSGVTGLVFKKLNIPQIAHDLHTAQNLLLARCTLRNIASDSSNAYGCYTSSSTARSTSKQADAIRSIFSCPSDTSRWLSSLRLNGKTV